MDFTSLAKFVTRQQLDSAPLSFAQQRVWFLDQLNSEGRVHNISIAIYFNGLLDVTALEQSLSEIVRHHEVLRTTFTSVDGQPLQVIAKDFPWKLSVVDLRELDETERQQESQRLISESVQQPFDLATGTLLRAVLQRLGEVEHILLLTIHEIVGDKWSLGLLLQELGTLYQAFSQGRPSPLVELPIQYADFAIWQRECLQNEVWASQQAYWKQQLEGELPVLELPTDHPRPPVQSYRGARQIQNLSQDLTDALKSLSRESGVTLFTTLLTAFKILLYRYTSLEDIIVGSKIANRNQAEFEGLIGLFTNTLVMRTDLGGNPSFRELLGRVQDVVLSAYSHQDLPFEHLVEELQTERDLSRSPLFQVMFVLENEQETRLEFPGVSLNVVEVESKSAKFDLTVEVQETSDGINGWFEYNADLFDADTIGRMIGHWEVLLAGVVAQPNQQIAYLPILTEAERHQLLVEWNNTDVDYPKDKCIHQLFEEQVERTPDHVAVVFEDEQLTYRELNARANQLAHYLQKLGVGPEVLVGICVERSLEMVVGLLGILKAGGAYVPLDPEYPKERLAFMLEDTQVSVLLLQKHLLNVLPNHNAQIVCLDQNWRLFAQEKTENLVSNLNPRNLIVIFYTSGSTGKPKGIVIEQISYLYLCLWYMQYYKITEKSRLLLFYSFSFDSSFKNIMTPLIAGGQLVLTKSFFSTDLLKHIHEKQVTMINTTTSFFDAILDFAIVNDYKNLSSLEELSFGGEPLVLTKIKLWLNNESCKCNVTNLYGTAESSDLSTVYRVNAKDINNVDKISIGKPIKNNVNVYILDKNNNLLPRGLVGELCVSNIGNFLARGYLNKPEITAEKFVSNPWLIEERMYKTGDLARWLPDGNLEYIGRIDHQVKIHGFRIEIGEIETVLRQYPVVQEAVVITRKDVLEDKCLVAYLVLNRQATVSISELRAFLNKKLPSYMIPSAFVILETFPLNPNGKVDRRLLPAPDKYRPDLKEAYIAPCTPLEEVLAGIWAEVLGIEQIGINDNFFELGGHSLLVVQVISRLRASLQVQLPLHYIFESPTISTLATAMIQDKDERSKIERTASLFLSVVQLSEDEVETIVKESF
ncbi:MAG: amino acid adenylation domain-containing protein [Dolichospermum sp. DL01]|nr:MAG: amino acid adenylation domain-containing protein [Dolichospermum sp. DL01]